MRDYQDRWVCYNHGDDLFKLKADCETNEANQKHKFIAYEKTTPEQDTSPIPDNRCVLESYYVKKTRDWNFVEGVLSGRKEMQISPESKAHQRDGKHFKAVDHANGKVKILNFLENKVLRGRPNGGLVEALTDGDRSTCGDECWFTIIPLEEGGLIIDVNVYLLSFIIGKRLHNLRFNEI